MKTTDFGLASFIKQLLTFYLGRCDKGMYLLLSIRLVGTYQI